MFSYSQVGHIFIHGFNKNNPGDLKRFKHNDFTCSQPDCLQKVVRLWVQDLQLVIWGKRLIVEYSSLCDTLFAHSHLILQQLHMRKKSPIGRSFAMSNNSAESHCVHATLLLDFDSKFWENPWCSSLEIVDSLSLDMDLMKGLNTKNMGDTSPLRNWFVPQNGLFSYKCKWDALTWCDLTLELLKAQVEGQIDKSNGYRSHEHFQSTMFIISIHFHTSLTHSHIGLE